MMSEPAAQRGNSRPVVAVLTAADEALPPGLDPLGSSAEIVHARDRASLSAALERAEILLVTDFRTTLLRETWTGSPQLRWVHATSAGVDALLFPELIESEVTLTNARGIFDAAIAEFVLAQILIFAKDFHTSLELQRRHEWRHRETERIEGREVLVVGAGSIGRRIAALLGAAGMRVAGLARSGREDPAFAAVHPSEALHDVLPTADFVVIATPLTEATRGLFGTGEFRAMKPQARLINIARGPIVVTDELVAALRGKQLAGAALDVFEQEPLPPNHPLYDMPEVIISAHMAGDFIGWREALSRQFIENFERWRRGEALHNVVDKRDGHVIRS